MAPPLEDTLTRLTGSSTRALACSALEMLTIVPRAITSVFGDRYIEFFLISGSGSVKSNENWQKFREDLTTSGAAVWNKGSDYWAQGPAAHRLYGGHMTEQRRMQAVSVTTVSILKCARYKKSMEFAKYSDSYRE